MALQRLLRLLPRIEPPADYFAGTAPYGSALPHNILLFHRRDSRALGPGRAHHHRFVLIVDCRTDGTVIIDDRSFRLRPGHAILIFPHQFHHYMDVAAPVASWLFVTFEHPVPERLAALRNVPLPVTQPLERALLDLVAAHTTSGDDTEVTLFTALLLERLMAAVLRSHPRPSEAPGVAGRFDELHRYIAGNMQRRLSMEELARHMALSASHLRLLYRKATGMSLRTYVDQMRLNRASGLLVGSAMRVKQIAAECGYDSLFSFSRAFKRGMGLSPREYRRKTMRRSGVVE